MIKNILYLILLSLFSSSFAYIITVDSHAEECFFDSAQAGSKLGKKILLNCRKIIQLSILIKLHLQV